jgi:cysteinyl-tRNA synthetase
MYLHNSLTNNLEKFDHDKNTPIKWYTCGPTIYDHSHLGHARTFISFDIVRRVLSHLGYSVIYVMNITDIDDKIINKVKQLGTYYQFINAMESEFWNDMDKLNIIRPTIVTRVTDYVDKIKIYIEKIESHDLCYVSNGTVYMDSQKYIEKNYKWDIFGRSTVNDYTDCEFSTEKKHNSDFALWKAAKPGEIQFESKWGPGRPGWHIECSTMSHDILGDEFDIHSGGIDLIHPHHSNEIIQSIAFNDCGKIPIQLFLHSGHLNINGEKMAKSLGNFITIKKYLETYSARQLRLLFVLHSWYKPMDFTQTVIEEVNHIEKRIVDFYANMNHFTRTANKKQSSFNDVDKDYINGLSMLKTNITNALLQNIDTKTVMKLLLDFIQTTYKYTANNFNINIVNDFITYSIDMLTMFGLDFTVKHHDENTDLYIDMLVDFRKDIRDILKENDIPKPIINIFYKKLDELRDVQLKPQGIIIEDSNLKKWKRI